MGSVAFAGVRNWYRVQDLIAVVTPIDLKPYGIIPKGATGRVVYVDPHSLYTEILMDAEHEALFTWRNHLWIIPPDTDDIQASIVSMGGQSAWLLSASLPSCA